MITNCLSVDLESSFHRQFNLSKRIKSNNSQLIGSTKALLDIFDDFSVKTTFFVVGEIYDQNPELIETIKKHGHEIAYHTHRHILLKNQEDLINELKLSRKFLARFRPIGFRAPRMFFKKEYFSILTDYGFKYDSSTYDSFSTTKNFSGIKELPVSLFSFFPNLNLSFPKNLKRSFIKGLPFGSGLFLSLFQKQIQAFINLINKQHQPAIFLIHPWQISHYQSPILLKELYNIPRLMYRIPINRALKYLLASNKFAPMRELL